MKIIAVLKIFLLLSWTFSAYLVYAAVLLVRKSFGLRFEPWRNRLMKIWGAGFMKILSIHIKVEGKPPDAPFLLVSNHLSYIDIPVYSSLLDSTFVSKKEVRHWPLIGFMAHTLGIIFIDRKRKRDVTRVNQEISEQLNEYQGIILFPEGMTSPGAEVLRFRPPLLEHAAIENIDVNYSAIRYQTESEKLPAHHSVCWWDGTPLHVHLFRLALNRRIEVTVRFGERTVTDADRKELAKKLHEEVSAIFEPVTDHPEETFSPLDI